MGIVEFSLVVIMKDLVGLADRLEFDFCCFTLSFRDLVRMTRKCRLYVISRVSCTYIRLSRLMICLLDLRFAGPSLYVQDL